MNTSEDNNHIYLEGYTIPKGMEKEDNKAKKKNRTYSEKRP